MHFSNSRGILFLTKIMTILYIGYPGTDQHSFANKLLDRNGWSAGVRFLNNIAAIQHELPPKPTQGSLVLHAKIILLFACLA